MTDGNGKSKMASAHAAEDALVQEVYDQMHPMLNELSKNLHLLHRVRGSTEREEAEAVASAFFTLASYYVLHTLMRFPNAPVDLMRPYLEHALQLANIENPQRMAMTEALTSAAHLPVPAPTSEARLAIDEALASAPFPSLSGNKKGGNRGQA